MAHSIGLIVNNQQVRSIEAVVNIQDSFQLKGYWVRISTGQKTGYVCDGDLSSDKPITCEDVKKQDVLYQRILSHRIGHHRINRTADFGGKEYLIIEEIVNYENGHYTDTRFDVCIDHTYSFTKVTLNEVYHLMTRVHSITMRECEERPIIQEMDNEACKFSGTMCAVKFKYV